MDKSEKNTQRAARQARLAAALRQNLKRRKAQSRERTKTGPEPSEKPAEGEPGARK
jgi:hypothetical protein